ncbi:Queuine tRNA-ribosyltransferase accessory subunit 2 [Coniochaeta hoffmannii]|uniref:Queuine tRNA-ribosyltransferase accessory subunit 2 n=1 Tax=Coniochaeta hoffmannii TaxID=91930 RepID=A0AA38RE43_9PEZI|nr:Queuine tRNA-ribosyltransferase accessory subunit 2 [Coniochaeta hoffmannii]
MTSETPETMRFDLLRTGAADGVGARLGRLVFSGGRTIETPNFFAITSRGAVPHITPDNLSKHVPVQGTYVALEDFIERSQANPTRTPPIYKTPATPSRPRPLHNFTITPPSTLTVLAARRLPAVASPQGNSTAGISVFTSTGFQNLSTTDYQTAVSILKPDMAIPLADLTNTTSTPNSKRATRMADRTEDWLEQWFSSPQPPGPETAIFAPTLPIPYALQWEYLTRLSSDFASSISGLAVYSSDIIPDLANHPDLAPKPRLSLDPPATPHHILRQIAIGADVFLLPFLNTISDSGVALTFSFPPPRPSPQTSAPSGGTSLLPLGKDLSDPSFAFSVAPLREGCGCYTCTAHHAAYVHHLLSAREMLGWTLLQIHNHHTLSDFFSGVRASLASGTFAEDSARFQTAYEGEVPAGTGERPRARGYHFKSEGAGEPKRNKKAWDAKLGGDEGEGLEGGVEGLKIGEVERRLERDLTETPVVPVGDGAELEREWFAEVDGKNV